MPRIVHEFQCTSCSGYFDIKLNTNLTGNFRIHCPECKHVHYREVKQGVISEVRFPQNDSVFLFEDIIPMKSSGRKYSKDTAENQGSSAQGFVARLWRELHG